MILFRTGAGPSMGWGHLVRSLAIADEVKGLGAPTACVLEGDIALARTLGAGRHELVGLAPDAPEPQATLAEARAAGAKVVLLDGYALGDAYEQALADDGIFVATLDDFGHDAHAHASLVVNSNLHYSSLPLYPRAQRARLLLGAAYAPLRRDIVDAREVPRPVQDPVRRIVVVLGGSDAGGSRERVLEMLASELPAGVEITVAGEQPLGSSFGGVRWVRSLRDVAQAIAHADIGISAGGMTSYELAYMGVPAVLLPATVEELPVSRELERLGSAVCLPVAGEWDRGALTSAFRRVASSRETREAMSSRGQSIFDGLGAGRIAKALVDALAAQ